MTPSGLSTASDVVVRAHLEGDVIELRDARGVEWLSFVILSGALVVLGVWPRLILTPLNAGVAEFLTRLSN